MLVLHFFFVICSNTFIRILLKLFFFKNHFLLDNLLQTLSICLKILSTLFSGVSSSFGKSIILPLKGANKDMHIRNNLKLSCQTFILS